MVTRTTLRPLSRRSISAHLHQSVTPAGKRVIWRYKPRIWPTSKRDPNEDMKIVVIGLIADLHGRTGHLGATPGTDTPSANGSTNETD